MTYIRDAYKTKKRNIVSAIRMKKQRFRACHAQGSAINPRIPGDLELGFQIPDLGLILKIWDLGLGFGIGFENLGTGIGIWDSFSQNPGSGIRGSLIADPWP